MAPNNTGALEAPLLAEEGGSAAGSDAGSSAGGSGGKGKGPPMNRNVRLTIVLAALSGLADSLWSNTVLSAYLFLLCKDRNAPVGQAEAVSGLSTLFTALPVGYLADKYSRSGVIAFGGVSYFLAMALTLFAILYTEHEAHAFLTICVALALWGLGGGIISGPVQALYADSVPQGDRSKSYTYMFAAWLLPSCVGPLISVAMFARLGDHWDLKMLRPVFVVGIALELPVAITMFLFRDKDALERAEHDNQEPAGADAAEDLREEIRWGPLRHRMIPYIMFCGDILISLGSGMTVKYFPLYFKNAVGLTPAQVQVVFALVPLFMVAMAVLAQKVSVTFGRVQCILVFRILGITLLGTMVYLAEVLHVESWHSMVPLYLVRTSLMNSAYPLTESILMDNVPRDRRARWKSLESVLQFGWCGSALVGGWIADNYKSNGHDGYAQTFAVTAIMQFTGCLIYCLLLPLVPKEEKGKGDGEAAPLLGPAAEDDD